MVRVEVLMAPVDDFGVAAQLARTHTPKQLRAALALIEALTTD